ncbi:hypothetical protein ABOM_008050 [Aspergillus bombycis]|uniref:Heterokaryon incompatibility domain-containing protein n=1 Tax=Aspergillus bombycis TaxID=109264 RepID=A0A1F7ZVK5_9EURO|nr:hypothetical protein ABOM_008050 [Aspergillus bombycis]OGM43503.1 hypothetical protein ABOM_008050 [Aspergillus bombycis]
MLELGNVSVHKLQKGASEKVETFYKEGAQLLDAASASVAQLRNLVLHSQQKHTLRRVLFYLVKPTILPKFTSKEEPKATEKPKSTNWFMLPAEDLKTPVRMIDLETKNMVSTVDLGPQDQYCILSHSWKGAEIDYGYFCGAKASTRSEGEEAAGDSSPGIESKHNDLQGVTYKCDKDLREAIDKLQKKLPIANGDVETVPSVPELLNRYIQAQEAKEKLAKAEKKSRDKERYLASAEHERSHYKTLLEPVKDLHYTAPTDGTTQDGKGDSAFAELLSKVEGLQQDAKDRRDKADGDLIKAREAIESQQDTEKLFTNNRHALYLVEQVLTALQRQRSARKIKESIEVAKELFERMPYSKGGKKYVWLDTCCINKSNTYELTESLALMGDWYANADFCLVHLDTRRSHAEWLQEYEYFEGHTLNPVEENISHLGEICANPNCWGEDCPDHHAGYHIEWAERGWTLQELVLSKMTYYVNSRWKLLSREIDAIGPYYPVGPFLEQYLNPSQAKQKNSTDAGSDGSASSDTPSMERIKTLIGKLETHGFVPPRHISNMTAEAQIAQAVASASGEARINRLLAELKDEICSYIKKDREEIRRFGRLSKLTSWATGIDPLSSAARNVLATASDRVTTVPTDQAYSLMGIMGVRFPAFSAEGLPKALARLLDEVVISSNEVSVFNWSGKHAGTPIQGRSLYPSNIGAFKDPIETPHLADQAKTNTRILELFQAERHQQSDIAKDVVWLLVKMMKRVKDLRQDCPDATSLLRLVRDIQDAEFSKLRIVTRDLEGIVNMLGDIRKAKKAHQDDKNGKKEEKTDKPGQEAQCKPTTFVNTGFSQLTGAMASFSPRKLPLTRFGSKRGSIAKETEPYADGHSNSPNTVPETVRQQGPAPRAEEQILQARIQDLAQKLKGQNNIIEENYERIRKTKDEKRNDPDKNQTVERDTRLVCPNPIVVSSAGIRGVFDIQRIIVKMEDKDRLRAQVVNAIEGQKIDGWCTISTGFAIALVAFSCDRDTLKQQLDMAHVVESELSEPQNQPNDGARPHDKPTADEDAQDDDGLTADDMSDRMPPVEVATVANSGLDARDETPDAPPKGSSRTITPEQKRVRRMIRFVQEPDLHAIAGEWVLARFSGVAGADWFLCRLELGSGSDLYGRRIATDAFSFQNAVPEKGLIDYWYQYMTEKKCRVCHAVRLYIERSILWDGARQKLHSLEVQPWNDPNNGQADDDLEEFLRRFSGNTFEKLSDVAIAAGKGAAGMGADLFARFLQARVEEGALKMVPPQLHAAVLDLDEGRHLFPVMFHSDTLVIYLRI